MTVLGIVLRSNRTLERQILDSAFAQFPIIGDQLQDNIHSLNKTGLGLLVGLLGTLFGARGIGSTMQHAANTIWGVPYRRRRGFPWNILRSLVLILVVGAGLLGSTVITGFAISEISFGLRDAAHRHRARHAPQRGGLRPGFPAGRPGRPDAFPAAGGLPGRRRVAGAAAPRRADRDADHRAGQPRVRVLHARDRAADLAGAVRPDRPAGDGGGRGTGQPALAARPRPAGADPR